MMLDRLTDKQAMDFVKQIEEPFSSLPHLPKGIVEFFVKIAPYLALLGAILSVLSGPIVALLGSFASLLTLSPLLLIWTVATVVLAILHAVLLFMAYQPLKNKELKGWMYLFWSQALSVLSSAFGLLAGFNSSIIGTLLGMVISFYILFEMKSSYSSARMGEVVEKMKKM